MKIHGKTKVYFLIILLVFAFTFYLDVQNIPSNWGVNIPFWQDLFINILAVAITIYGTINIISWQIKGEKREKERENLFSLLIKDNIFLTLYMGVSENGNVFSVNKEKTDYHIKSGVFDRTILNEFLVLISIFLVKFGNDIKIEERIKIEEILDNYQKFFYLVPMKNLDELRDYGYLKTLDKFEVGNEKIIFWVNHKKYFEVKDCYGFGEILNVDNGFVIPSNNTINGVKLTLDKQYINQINEFRNEVNRNSSFGKKILIFTTNFSDLGDFSTKHDANIIFNSDAKEIMNFIYLFLSK